MATIQNASIGQAPDEIFIFPPSFGQKRLWFSERLNAGRPSQNMPMAVRILGHLDLDVLNRSLREVVSRHESLRTHFKEINGEPQQVIHSQIDVEIPVVDLGPASATEREKAVSRLVNAEASVSFDLRSLPLWRVKLFQLSGQEYVLVLVVHHIISDGWSVGVMVRELSLLYSAFISGNPSPFPDMPFQFVDFSEWQRQLLQNDSIKRGLEYWKERLSGTVAVALPYDRPKRSPYPSEGGAYSLCLDEALSQRVVAFSRQHGATLYMVLLSAYQVLLGHYAKQEDIALGTVVANREQVQLQGVVGYLMNHVVIRIKLSDTWSFLELLSHVNKTVVEAYAHQNVPLEWIIEELRTEIDPNRPMIAHATFNLQNLPSMNLRLGSALVQPFPLDVAFVKNDLAVFVMVDDRENISVNTLFNRDVFDAATIVNVFQQYHSLLQNIVDQPEKRIPELLL